MQEDDDGKEAKWADIDDDEDDWAPETIEWNDGTKITLSQNETTPAPEEKSILPMPVRQNPAEAVRPKLSLAKPTTTVGPNATVLKLGSANQPKPGGLVLKGPSDKPTLVARPSAPTSVKSPWASLPPVDKISPLPANPPAQSPSLRFSQKDPHGFDSLPPPPSPAKEIAADDFSRSLRDTQIGTQRELFDSKSGRYEPVSDARRGSMRKDQNFRPPSLLQRPSPSDPHGPAEPSAAFQTNRAGAQQDIGPYNRRRNSSNLSGDSGNQGRRMSTNRASDLPRIPAELDQQPADSQIEQSPLTPGYSQTKHAQRDLSPAQLHNQSIASQSPTTAMSQQVTINASASASPQQNKFANTPIADGTQDAVAVQKKLMREKRELAIKRKKEEEEREDAEKRERIRMKMEELGLLPLEEKKGKKEVVAEIPLLPAQLQEASLATLHSPPKPPVPDVSGEPKQYGMMKVHAPIKNGLQLSNEAIQKVSDESPGLIEKVSSPVIESKVRQTNGNALPLINGDSDQTSGHISTSKSTRTQHQDNLATPQPQSWKDSQQGQNGFSNWSNANMTTHSSPGGNLWGPPSSHNRALGNGDFNRSIQRPQSRQLQFQQNISSPAPQPIGPPRLGPQPSGSQGTSRALEAVTQYLNEDSQTLPAFSSSDAVPTVSSAQVRPPQTNNVANASTAVVTLPVTSSLSSVEKTPRANDTIKSGLSAWANFHVTSTKENEKATQDHLARLAEEQQTGGSVPELQLPVMSETWRQVKVNDQVGQRHVVGTLKSQSTTPEVGHAQQPQRDGRPISLPKTGNGTSTVGPVRSSRFFPAAQAVYPHNQRAVSLNETILRPSSPPPPDSANHPAFAGVSHRPLVRIPFVKPKPTVKLPPSLPTPTQSPVMFEHRVTSSRAVSQPSINNTSWQDRINVLVGRKASPEKKFAHVVEFSTSKVPFEVASLESSAAVSLPPQEGNELLSDLGKDSKAESKAVEEEDELFENRDFGSVPTVLIPTVAPVPLWQPARTPRKSRMHPKTIKEAEVVSIRPMSFDLDENDHQHPPNGFRIAIRIPGIMTTARFKVMPRHNGHSTVRNQPQHQPIPPRSRHGKGQKPKDPSALYGNSKSSPNGPLRNASQVATNPQSRSKSYNSNNNNLSWARRASGVVQ